jgi:nucleoside-diphosphate-sugar epimerase
MPFIETHLTPMSPVIDMKNNVAAIPGSGDEPVVFSYSLDVAKVVARLLDLPQWQETTFIVGDKLTWNEFLKLAEDAKGQSKQSNKKCLIAKHV